MATSVVWMAVCAMSSYRGNCWERECQNSYNMKITLCWKKKHASELAAARMKPGMAVSAPWAEQTLLWSFPDCSLLDRTVPRLSRCRPGVGFPWLRVAISIWAAPLSPIYVQVISSPCKGYTGSVESHPQISIFFCLWLEGSRVSCCYMCASSVWSWAMGVKASMVPAAACWALVAGKPRIDCISGVFLSCPRKCTQVIHSHVNDLLYFGV